MKSKRWPRTPAADGIQFKWVYSLNVLLEYIDLLQNLSCISHPYLLGIVPNLMEM